MQHYTEQKAKKKIECKKTTNHNPLNKCVKIRRDKDKNRKLYKYVTCSETREETNGKNIK